MSTVPKATLPAWRSILYVPANAPRLISSAPTRGADAIQLDLEDSVPPEEKAGARERLRAAARTVGAGGADVLVRINRPLSLAVRDIEAAICPEVRAITITKVDGASHVRLIDELVGECEVRAGMEVGSTRLMLLIETVRGLAQLEEMARASDRVAGVALGSEDFALDAGMAPLDEVLLGPKQQLVLGARASGVLALGFIGSLASLDDMDGFRAMVRRSRQFGFECATCIHPRQVAIVNEEYGIASRELEYAQRLLAEHARQAAQGIGAFRLEGRMVDAPMVERARQLVARAAAFRPAA